MKITIANYLQFESEEPEIVAVVVGDDQESAKRKALEFFTSDNPDDLVEARLISPTEEWDTGHSLEQRFADDGEVLTVGEEEGWSDWSESGTVWITVHDA